MKSLKFINFYTISLNMNKLTFSKFVKCIAVPCLKLNVFHTKSLKILQIS